MQQVDVGDSSDLGFALLTSRPQLSDIQQAWSFHEKWRFIPMPQIIKTALESGTPDDLQAILTSLDSSSGPPSESLEASSPFQLHSSGGFRFGAGLGTQYGK